MLTIGEERNVFGIQLLASGIKRESMLASLVFDQQFTAIEFGRQNDNHARDHPRSFFAIAVREKETAFGIDQHLVKFALQPIVVQL